MTNTQTAPQHSREQRRLRARYGPWAIVTGASDGIGLACARHLAAAGLHLVLVARRAEVLASLAKELQEGHDIETRVLALDLSLHNAVEELAAQTKDLEVGLLVASAGFGTSGQFIKASLQDELAMIDVNCRAVAALSYLFANRFAAQRRGGLVLLSSLVAFQGVPRAANYAATKAYVQSLAEGLRLELSSAGVDVVSSAPGPVSSGFANQADMKMSMALHPKLVAEGTLYALGRSGTVRPGWLSKFLELSLMFLPRWGRVRIMALVMGGMTKHRG